LERNELREDDIDAYHESRFDTGDWAPFINYNL
jgi:hypothetical protein